MEHYKESDPASAKGAQAMASEVMEELVAVEAIASKVGVLNRNRRKENQEIPRKEMGSPRISRRKALEHVMDVVEQDTSSENALTPIRSL